MIKGWRTNPAWVAHYEAKKGEQQQRKLEMVKLHHELAMRVLYANTRLSRSSRAEWDDTT